MSDEASTNLPAPRRKPIPKRIKRAIEALLSGQAKTVAAAAGVIGCSREHLSRELSRPHIRAYYQDRVSRALMVATGRAAVRLDELIDAQSEKVALDASKHTLAIAGHRPASDASVNVNVNVRAGYVIQLSDPDKPMKVVSPAPPNRVE